MIDVGKNNNYISIKKKSDGTNSYDLVYGSEFESGANYWKTVRANNAFSENKMVSAFAPNCFIEATKNLFALINCTSNREQLEIFDFKSHHHESLSFLELEQPAPIEFIEETMTFLNQ